MALLGSLIGIIALICAVWVIYDILTNNKKLSDTSKLIWIICAVIFSIITAIIYYFMEKK